ncbi:MAG TPA: helix-turn-helix domain-containing protein [Candidatus Eisenbergiella merdipullorum]|uniref:Helix-turn-helix domain-containing protein n=1 Tax=Candidatus Eisenbergiella merdipullorum TaxID=2838553 RepID=A0A9D2L167_9FIRM|nr:helix-turn-helix domain-containing protein [Candidatus Eisenbergiella merdipullorum]
MDYADIERGLMELRDYEKNAKCLYGSNPEAFDHVVWSWEEFSEGFRRTARTEVELGEKPGFSMKSLLTEQDFFSEEGKEVSVLLHDRYVPPFYHSLKFIKIVYALRGDFFFYLRENGRDRRTRMEEGDFVIIPPEVSQAVFTGDEGAVTVNVIIKRSTFGEAFYSLLMENDSISDFFWQMLYSKGNERALLVRCGRDGRLRNLILEMCAEGILDRRGSAAGKNLMMKGYVMLLFGRTMKEHSGEMESIGHLSEADAVLPEMIRYIRKNYTTVTLPTLAEHFGKSEGYLSRYIRRETGKTFRFLLKEFRMKQAVQMIENSSCSIEEVAAAVGYADISCFYRNFRESFSMTPMQYRNIRSRISI